MGSSRKKFIFKRLKNEELKLFYLQFSRRWIENIDHGKWAQLFNALFHRDEAHDCLVTLLIQNAKMIGRYILVDGKPVPESDLLVWAAWLETADRHVARDEVGGVIVSTIFLGLDHSLDDMWPPVLWETMVFGGRDDEDRQRYSSEEAARAGHAEVVARIKGRVYDRKFRDT